jgi:hypothetical protein
MSAGAFCSLHWRLRLAGWLAVAVAAAGGVVAFAVADLARIIDRRGHAVAFSNQRKS